MLRDQLQRVLNVKGFGVVTRSSLVRSELFLETCDILRWLIFETYYFSVFWFLCWMYHMSTLWLCSGK